MKSPSDRPRQAALPVCALLLVSTAPMQLEHLSPYAVFWTAPAILAAAMLLAWKQQTPLLIANLTGALRLLTGLGWPMIYFTAAFFHRRHTKRPLREIR